MKPISVVPVVLHLGLLVFGSACSCPPELQLEGESQDLVLGAGLFDQIDQINTWPTTGLVVTAEHSGRIMLWDAQTGLEVGPLTDTVFRHPTNPYIFPPVTVRFLPRARSMAYIENTGMLRIWDIESRRVIRRHPFEHYIEEADISGNGAWLCISSQEVIAVYDIRQEIKLAAQYHRKEADQTVVHFTPSGQHVMVAFAGGSAALWDFGTGRTIRAYRFPSQVEKIAFSPKGDSLATGTYSGAIDLWNTQTGDKVRSLARDNFDTFAGPGGQPTVFALAYSPDGSRLAAARGSGVMVWDVETGEKISEWAQLGRMAGVGFTNEAGTGLAIASLKSLRLAHLPARQSGASRNAPMER